jgi:hypothetical protein
VLIDVIGTLPPTETLSFVYVIIISYISYRFIAIFDNKHEIIYIIINDNSYYKYLAKKNFFSNKINKTLKIIIEVRAIDELRNILFEFFLLKILGEATPHLPHPQNHHCIVIKHDAYYIINILVCILVCEYQNLFFIFMNYYLCYLTYILM